MEGDRSGPLHKPTWFYSILAIRSGKPKQMAPWHPAYFTLTKTGLE